MPTYGIDANALTLPRRTGVEHYLASLIEAMKRVPLVQGERVVLYAARETPELLHLPQGWEWKRITFPLRQGWTHGRLSWELLTHPPDVFFSPAHELPVLHRKAKVVATVHDVAFAHLPEVYGTHMNLRQEWAIRHATRCASVLLTPSETTKKDLEELYAVPPERIVVTPLAGNASLPMVPERIPSYFLCVGRLEKKKNQQAILRAIGNHPLVLVGKEGLGSEEIRKEAAKHPAVEVRGHVNDTELASLYAGATALLVPSLYEGFGLMVLEAMQRGIPVIASDIPAFREVAGDAAIFVHPLDVDEWRRAIDHVVSSSDVQVSLKEKGRQRVATFSWEKTAACTWDVLRCLA